MNKVESQPEQTAAGTAKIVYILYLSNIFFVANIFFGVTAIIGVIMAYVNRADAPPWLQSHYQFQIRTFWILLLYFFIGGLLALVFIGYLLLLFAVVWLIVRCVNGMKWLDMKQSHPNPTTWWF